MAKLSEKIKITLDECRMLVLGTQVLISLQFELAFQGAFDDAPADCRKSVAIGLALLLLTFILLLWGPAYQRIAENGKDSPESHAFMTRVICWAMFPLAIAMGVDAFIAFSMLGGFALGVSFGALVTLACSIAWYALGAVARRSQPPEVRQMNEKNKSDSGGEKLHTQVNEVLTEGRVVLPGAQAMLGFQFITFFEKAFSQLPKAIQVIHLICLSMIALTVILLMIPPAFHRIAEGGEDSHRLVRLSSIAVISAMVPLCVGMSGDFFVIVFKITQSLPLAIACGGVALATFIALWFGYTTYRRSHRPTAHKEQFTPAIAHAR